MDYLVLEYWPDAQLFRVELWPRSLSDHPSLLPPKWHHMPGERLSNSRVTLIISTSEQSLFDAFYMNSNGDVDLLPPHLLQLSWTYKGLNDQIFGNWEVGPLEGDPGSGFYSCNHRTWRIFSWHWSLLLGAPSPWGNVVFIPWHINYYIHGVSHLHSSLAL